VQTKTEAPFFLPELYVVNFYDTSLLIKSFEC